MVWILFECLRLSIHIIIFQKLIVVINIQSEAAVIRKPFKIQLLNNILPNLVKNIEQDKTRPWLGHNLK